jgi:hypothetical protein
MHKWQYRIVLIAYTEVEQEFNTMGAEGWELVQVVPTGDNGVGEFYFKREVPVVKREVPVDMRCAGCGLDVLHKMCIAHGTEAYMNPDHPAWGNEEAIKQLKENKTNE